jgi:hypothetical protein
MELNDDIKKLNKEFEKQYNYKNNSKYIRNTSLKGKHKKFSSVLHDKFDEPARKKIKDILGDFVEDNPNPYKQDLIITSSGCKYKYLELQVINQWIGERYPYKTVYIYERKAIYKDDTLFLTLNKNLTKGFLFDKKSIEGKKPRRFKKWSQEFVYDIPWQKILTIYTSSLDKETIQYY